MLTSVRRRKDNRRRRFGKSTISHVNGEGNYCRDLKNARIKYIYNNYNNH
jgi:hypothetical protein